MSQRECTINHCDVCAHEWIPKADVNYTHCTSGKCRSRKWNTKSNFPVAAPAIVTQEMTDPHASKPDMQALRDICMRPEQERSGIGNLTPEQVDSAVFPSREIPICGKTWWEDGTRYECLMDSAHRELKHGMRGMVRRLDD